MSFEETIIHCSAPALCGIKPASLFSLSSALYSAGKCKLEQWQNDFLKSNRHFVSLQKENNRVLMFIFDRTLLESVISSAENALYLKSKGYSPESGFSSVLGELLRRLSFNREFPHEVGLFLGYPLCDVIGFERDSSDFKYSGFWKVYGDQAEAERKMKMYKSCSEKCMEWLAGGMSVPMAVRKYQNFEF